MSDDVWVVAPGSEQSGAGHALTLRRPLRLQQQDERVYAVDGTPTDCVLLAVGELLTDHRPDLVLSGVNYYGNLADDVTYSGTVAAAMEATILGLPAIALSQEFNGADMAVDYWRTGATHGAAVIRQLVARGWPANTLINVNFPASCRRRGPWCQPDPSRSTQDWRSNPARHRPTRPALLLDRGHEA